MLNMGLKHLKKQNEEDSLTTVGWYQMKKDNLKCGACCFRIPLKNAFYHLTRAHTIYLLHDLE